MVRRQLEPVRIEVADEAEVANLGSKLTQALHAAKWIDPGRAVLFGHLSAACVRVCATPNSKNGRYVGHSGVRGRWS